MAKVAKRDEVPGLGAILKGHRSRLEMTLAQVAEESGVTLANLSLFERDAKTPTLATLYKIARAYSVTVSDLLPADALAALPPDEPEDRPAKRK